MTGGDDDRSTPAESDRGDADGGAESFDGTGADWPVDLTGVTESLVTTCGPNDRWNVAPLGLFAGEPVTATTWGQTRTRRNVERTGEGYVQFVTDPVLFVDAALSIVETAEPVLSEAHAWVRVDVTRIESGNDGETEWVRWALTPTESQVISRRVPTLSRGVGAILEASVVASRLDVPGYDETRGREVLSRASDVVERTGGPRERKALDRLLDHVASDLPPE